MARKKGKGIIKTDHIWKFFGDGLWEIGLGLIIIWGGVLVRMKWSILWIMPALVLLFLVYFLKRKYVFPHAKDVHLPRIKKRVTQELIILALIIFIVMLTLLKTEPGLGGYWSYLQKNTLTMIGVILATACLFIGFISKITQYFLHAIMILLTFFLDASVFIEAPLGMAIGAGIIMLISGIVNFRQFQKSH